MVDFMQYVLLGEILANLIIMASWYMCLTSPSPGDKAFKNLNFHTIRIVSSISY